MKSFDGFLCDLIPLVLLNTLILVAMLLGYGVPVDVLRVTMLGGERRAELSAASDHEQPVLVECG